MAYAQSSPQLMTSAQMVAAPVVTGLSYVPPMVDMGMSQTGFATPALSMMPTMPLQVQPPAPSPPERLTTGIPDPSAIEQQKAAYSKGLDDQLRQGAAILNQQLKQQMDQLHSLGDQQKQKYFVQVDHEIKSQELGLVQQFKEQLLMVQQAAAQQKRILGQQATALLLEYNQKKAQEDNFMEEYNISKTAYDNQTRFTQEFTQLQQQQATATQAAMAQQQAVEQHAAQAMQAIEEQRMQVAQQMAAQSKLVQSADNIAATATGMYAMPTQQYFAGPSMSTVVPAPSTVSYTPAPMTTMGGPTLSYTPAPATTVSLPTVSYTPAPVLQQGMAYGAAPATVITRMG